MSREKRYVRPGERVKMLMPWSEVCMHMRVHDTVMEVEFILKEWPDHTSATAQLYKDGRPFSSPILYGEAGFYHEGGNDAFRIGEGFYYYPPKAA
jgi:hypothetical protein